MKTEDLKGLGLSDEQILKVMVENGVMGKTEKIDLLTLVIMPQKYKIE